MLQLSAPSEGSDCATRGSQLDEVGSARRGGKESHSSRRTSASIMERGLTASREDGGSDSAAGESGIVRDILAGALNIWIVVVGAQRV